MSKQESAFEKLKNPFWRARWRYVKYVDRLPLLDRCVLVESQQGTQMQGNMFYILQWLCQNEAFRDWEIYVPAWLRHQQKIRALLDAHHMQQVKLVDYGSDQYFRLLASAKYLFNDNTFHPAFLKKDGQVYVNTWHGTPLKNLGRRMIDARHSIGNAQKNFIVSDYLLFPNVHTRNAIIEDYMVGPLSGAKEVYGGYPRNAVFFDTARQDALRRTYNPQGKRLYAYMPTFRGAAAKGGTDKNSAYLKYYLYELDKRLGEDELLYVNLHPVAQKNVNFQDFSRIRPFPEELETYEFLSLADCLVTDYSSVFFDYAVTRRKIVLFVYDREDYLRDRGMYMQLEDLPFPKVTDLGGLLEALRTEKDYDDQAFLQTFCPYDGPDATDRLCRLVFQGQTDALEVRDLPRDERENVVIYAGNLAGNGITATLRNLLGRLDLNERNYYLAFQTDLVADRGRALDTFPSQVRYITMLDDMDLTATDRIVRKLFKWKLLPASAYMRLMAGRIRQNWRRCFGSAPFHAAIQFNGYEQEVILLFSQFPGRRFIYVHSDMLQEMKTKGNQRRDVLRYAYRAYDAVAVVTPDCVAPTRAIAGDRANIKTVRNIIDYETILRRAQAPVALDDTTLVYPDRDAFRALLDDPGKTFISIGRFAPEKAHDRLVRAFHRFAADHPDCRLVIMGGYSLQGCYDRLCTQVQSLGLDGRVVLLQGVSNPYPILKACDCLILSSLYEGFGLVLAEADVLGKPVVSTDITGPRGFMEYYGGKLVESSEAGILQGLELLYLGQVPPLGVNYEAYNRMALKEFEDLFSQT